MIATTDIELVADILADGFFDNPLSSWIFPDDESRGEALYNWYLAWAEVYGSNALCCRLDNDIGAALWAGPELTIDAQARSKLVDVIDAYSCDRADLVLAGLAKLSAQPTEPHWYLNAIAVVPDERGRGAGAKLIEPMLERADRDGVPIYLESTNPRNLSFYGRYRFETAGDPVAMPQNGPVAQPMIRRGKP